MTKTIIKVLFSTLLIISSLSAQRETVGVEYNYHDRGIDSLITKANILSMSYRNELPSGTRITASLGLDYVKFFDTESATEPTLKSTNQIFVQLEGLQKFYYMYLKGAVQFYSVKGNAVEETGGFSAVSHDNVYRIFEFPLGAGFTFPIDVFDFYIGVNKVYFYGTNQKEIIVNNGGTETNLGSSSRRTFKTDLGLGAEATILYHFSNKLEFELNLIKYEKEDFSVRFSVWGPLQRMLLLR
jgi:hypothetical protein